VIRVREQAPLLWCCEQLVARPSVSDHLPVRVQSIRVHADEDGVLAELTSVGLEALPCLNARRTPIRTDGRSEVIPDGAAIRHVDCLSLSDRKERHVTKVGHASDIPFCVAPDVLVQERLNRGRHQKDCGSRAGAGQRRTYIGQCDGRNVTERLDGPELDGLAYSPVTHKRRPIWRRSMLMLQLRCNALSGGVAHAWGSPA
jgi:hypothetical protein